MVYNAKHPCARCDAQFIDTDVKLKLSKEWVCGRCSDGRSTNKMVDYKLNEVPDFIKNASALELNLCSINIVNTYKFSLQRKGPKNRFQYQSVVFENDLSSLTKLVLPRLPESCKYLIVKRGNIDKKCDHLKVDVARMKKILKF